MSDSFWQSPLSFQVKLSDGRLIPIEATLGQSVSEVKFFIAKYWAGDQDGNIVSNIILSLEENVLQDNWVLVSFVFD